MRDILAHPFLSEMSTKSSDLSMMSSDWFPSPELIQELKWIERGEYASATLEDSLEFKPASTALLRRIKKKFEMGGARGMPKRKRRVQRVDVIRNPKLISACEAITKTIEQRIETHVRVFKKSFREDGVKSKLHRRLQSHWSTDSAGLKHAKLMACWHGCSMVALPSICAYGTADLRTTDGGFFGAGICE